MNFSLKALSLLAISIVPAAISQPLVGPNPFIDEKCQMALDDIAVDRYENFLNGNYLRYFVSAYTESGPGFNGLTGEKPEGGLNLGFFEANGGDAAFLPTAALLLLFSSNIYNETPINYLTDGFGSPIGYNQGLTAARGQCELFGGKLKFLNGDVLQKQGAYNMNNEHVENCAPNGLVSYQDRVVCVPKQGCSDQDLAVFFGTRDSGIFELLNSVLGPLMPAFPDSNRKLLDNDKRPAKDIRRKLIHDEIADCEQAITISNEMHSGSGSGSGSGSSKSKSKSKSKSNNARKMRRKVA